MWEFLEKGYNKASVSVEAFEDLKKKYAKTLFFIRQAVDESIATATKSSEAWKALQIDYQGITNVLTIKL